MDSALLSVAILRTPVVGEPVVLVGDELPCNELTAAVGHPLYLLSAVNTASDAAASFELRPARSRATRA